jgi:hypothetical protein
MQASLLSQGEIKIEGQPNIVLLRVRVLTCVVLVLIVCVELQASADGEQATRKEIRRAPFVVLALIVGFSGNIRDEMIGSDRKGAFEGQFVPIAPGETAVLPVQIRSIAIREVKPGHQGKVRRRSHQDTIFGCSIWRGDVAVSGFQNQES